MRCIDRISLSLILVSSVATLMPGSGARAQGPDELDAAAGIEEQPPRFASPGIIGELVTIGSVSEDRIRLSHLLEGSPTAGFLIRAPSTLSAPFEPGARPAMQLLLPEVRVVWNSDLPSSLNEGNLWAGRGTGYVVSAGLRMGAGPVTLTIAPELVHEENLPFQVIPYPNGDRSPFASPWHTEPESLDLPLRFGDEPRTALLPGQSSIRVDAGPAELGLSTESQWWGPGIRNAIVMSNNAPGVPHAFVRTATPVRTRIGSFEGKLMLGRLVESAYFDTIRTNDNRSISAFALTYTPAAEPTLTLGLTRAVYEGIDELAGIPLRALDAFMDVGRPNDRSSSDLVREPGPDQIFSLFGRWVFPRSGLETYAEWSRTERPKSFRDLLVAPHHTQGYTVGLQWARPVFPGGAVRLQAESTFLEASSTFRYRRVIGYYKSRPVEQGYTHRGRIVGAAIGSGGSSQWIAADLVGRRGAAGVFVGRIRWENDAFFAAQVPPAPADHDVSIFVGGRASWDVPWFRLETEAMLTDRLNYLFQNPSWDLANPQGVDIRNLTLRVSLRPRARAGTDSPDTR